MSSSTSLIQPGAATLLSSSSAVPTKLSPEEVNAALRFHDSSLAPASKKAYQHDINAFQRFLASRFPGSPCVDDVRQSGKDELLAFFLDEAAKGRKVATINHRLACLRKYVCPDLPASDWEHISTVIKGMRRTTLLDDRQVKGKDALLSDDLTKLLASVAAPPHARPVDIRNRALFLFLFYSAMRRSEVSALRWSDIDYQPNGIIVRIRHSKTDQEGSGQLVDIHAKPQQPDRCTVKALQEWKALLAPTAPTDWVFPHVLRGSAIVRSEAIDGARILKTVKAQCEAAGLDSSKFGAHSLRSGFITSGAMAGIPAHQLQAHARHRNPATTQSYCKRSQLLADDCPTNRI